MGRMKNEAKESEPARDDASRMRCGRPFRGAPHFGSQRVFVLALLLGGGLLVVPPGALQAQESQEVRDFVVVAHPGVAMQRVEASFVARAFLKRNTRWPDGTPIRPVDLRPDSSLRRLFSREIIGRSVSAVRNHWQQAIFTGRDLPPPELDSEAQVLEYVRTTPGAIGYVSPGAQMSGVVPLDIE